MISGIKSHRLISQNQEDLLMTSKFPGKKSSGNQIGLRHFSKFVCLGTLFLIFAGGLVTSTGSGLSVPDWPLSYGQFFPPMVGGVFYEHGHRMVASFVGLLVIILTVWIARVEKRRWVKNLTFCVLGTVVVQGLLGGLTVLFLLPKAISISHAVLAQTFFVLTIIIAYSQSVQYQGRLTQDTAFIPAFARMTLLIGALVYAQLIFGALMRHTASGLTIPDFPTMGWKIIPRFNEEMLRAINSWRFDQNLDPVNMAQVFIHFLHRAMAAVILFFVILLNCKIARNGLQNKTVYRSVLLFDILLIAQITLGALTVLSKKSPHVTSLHVMVGALTLGVSVLLVLQSYPIKPNVIFKK